MKIERVTFLALTAAIAAACSSTKEPVAPVIVPENANAPDASNAGGRPKTIEEIVADGGGTPVVVAESPDASSRDGFPAACSLDEVGDPKAWCGGWKVDPTGESGAYEIAGCKRLWGDRQKSFKPRVAENIVACMTKRPYTKATGCKPADMHKCIREAVDKACIEQEMTAECERIVAKCKARGRGLTFTVEQCAKIASSMGPELRDWATRTMGGDHFDGTPMAEGCTLQYITVYQPWPKNWWTGK